jgi:signal transduction histidine kinase
MGKLRFRGRQWLLLALFLLFVIALFNAAGWLLYRRATSYLDDQMGQKLEAIAATAALGLSPDLVESAREPGALFLLNDYVRQIQEENTLETVHLFDPEGKILASTSRLSDFTVDDPSPALDREAWVLATSGLPSASRLYEVDGFYLKSGYAPVENLEGEVLAILAAEASAGYFRVLEQFKKSMIALGGVSVLFLVAAGLLFFKLIDSLAQAEMAVMRSDALATLGRMAAHMAHEIRNPLGIIRGAVQRLQDSSSVEKKDRELLDFLPEEVDRLDEIVSRYLHFARVEPLQLTAVDPVRLVNETVAMVRRELTEKGIQVILSTSQAIPPIRLDAQRIKGALLNLLLNAMEAMTDGGEIRVTVTGEKKWIHLSVSDTGHGIPKGQLKAIFEPFFTTKEKGSGLGLALVAKVVEEHRGRVEVHSQPEKGATFVLSLPRH